MQMAKDKGIAVEICPLSNKALGLCENMWLHPAGIMFRNNYPVTVSSDDPAFWNAIPLSHDMLAAFLFLMSEQQGVHTESSHRKLIHIQFASPNKKKHWL